MRSPKRVRSEDNKGKRVRSQPPSDLRIRKIRVFKSSCLNPHCLSSTSHRRWLLRRFSSISSSQFAHLVPQSQTLTEHPREQLMEVVKSMLQKTLSAPISDIGSVISMIDRMAGSALGNGSQVAICEGLVTLMKGRVQARNFVTLDGYGGKKDQALYKRNAFKHCIISWSGQLTIDLAIEQKPFKAPLLLDALGREVMTGKKIIAICQLGGEFRTEEDGSLSYACGDAHAIDIDDQMNFNDFKLEVAEMFNCSIDSMIMKYFLPGNKKTLITISNDKDLKRMIKFSGDSITVDIYLMREEVVAPDVSNMPASRSSRTTLSEAVVLPVDAPLDVVDDTTNPDVTLGVSLDVVDGTAQMDDHIDIPTEVPFILPLHSSNAERHVKSALQWENTITGVGQRFNSVNDFRETLRKYAIAHQFAFKYKKNDSHRVTVKCKAEGCPWRIHASRLTTTQLICIKKMNPTHTCEGSVSTTGYQATRSWVAGIIKEKLKVFPNYKPKDIVSDIKQEYGIQLNYFQAWRGKEIAKEQLQGSCKEAYKQLPIFCEKIMETSPGSLATFTTKEDSSFHRLFVAFHASLYGFQQGCRPLLFLDSIPLKSKYQGMLLAATAVDGDDSFFPVAFAIVDAETDDNWRWFLVQLQAALPTSQAITFVADRRKGLKESISMTFENSFHGYCLHYLSEQLLKDLKGQFSNEVKRLMVMDFYAAAYATRLEEFQRCVETIKNISLEAYNWVMQSEPKHWANAFFEGARYNHMMSNFGELFCSWVSEANELPIIQMVDVIRGKIMELICTRQRDSNQWLTRLTPTMEEKLEKENTIVRSLQVLLSAGSTFEVRGDSVEIVDIDNWVCTCKGWQLSGLPCSHAIAVFGCIGRNPYDYCSRYFTTEVYRLTYMESINPIPDVGRPLGKGSPRTTVMVTPPPTRRPPGRPTTKQMGPQEMVKRQLQCSRCKGAGHNKSTCKNLS
ncbi:MULE transposase domain [Dillenia turbinata]|uniref:MULE transposase domain n=1 Tax=Dillenia turbinata TaxID=194707 RepID=A0AAN8UIG5_9MAGN